MYTAQQVRDERISFKPMSRAQFDKLKAHFEKLYPGDYSKVSYGTSRRFRFYQEKYGENLSGEQANDLNSSYLDAPQSIKSTKEISFEEFDFQKREIIGYKCPTSLFGNLIKEGTVYKPINNSVKYVYGDYIPDDKQATAGRFKLPKEIVETWVPVYEEQFKVGDWVTYLPDTGGEGTHQITEWASAIYCQLSNGKAPFKVTLRKATLEEIAAAQTKTKTVRMGGENGFDLIVKDGKVFHKTEDITDYVTQVHNSWKLRMEADRIYGANYAFKIKDIILSKTGCENKETKLSEWLALYELIKP